MKLGVDLDGVLVDNYSVWIAYYEERAKEGCHNSFDWASGDAPIWDYFQPVCKKCWNDCLHLGRFIKNYKPREGAYEALRTLKEHNIELHLITSRPADVGDWTKEWVEKYFPDIFKSVTITGLDKVPLIKQLGLGAMLDDAPHNIEAVSNKTDAAILIWDMPYNKGLPGLRLYNFEDLVNVMLYIGAIQENLDFIGRTAGTGRRHYAYKKYKKQGVLH